MSLKPLSIVIFEYLFFNQLCIHNIFFLLSFMQKILPLVYKKEVSENEVGKFHALSNTLLKSSLDCKLSLILVWTVLCLQWIYLNFPHVNYSFSHSSLIGISDVKNTAVLFAYLFCCDTSRGEITSVVLRGLCKKE